ncbi:MAG TPA: hypothetical protein VGM98_02550 [Schlesneria sp.]|jgi:hypothetical protein
MKEYFHAWRRKACVVTLVMALALCAMWVRSHTIRDQYLFGSGSDRECQSIISTAAGIYWRRDKFPPDKGAIRYSRSYQPGWAALTYHDSETKDFTLDIDTWHEASWQWR